MKKQFSQLTHKSAWGIRLIVCILVVISLPTIVAHAQPTGTTIQVNTFTDELNVDPPDFNGKCSLREAITAANKDISVDACPAGNGTDAIMLPAGTYTLSLAGIDEDDAATGDLDITGDLRITGHGPDGTVIDGGSIDRVFHVVGSGHKVGFYGLVIQNGNAADTTLFGGGAILNYGELTISGCTFRDNQTIRNGGAIDNTNYGALYLSNSTFHNNSAPDGGGLYNKGMAELTGITFYANNGGERGGAFDNWNNALLTNVTISGNTAVSGGGVFTDGILTLLNVTITNNSSGIANRGDTRAKSTMIVNSTGGDDKNCTDSSVTSEGNNLDSGNSCDFNDATDQSNTNPQLGALSDNGGPTWTHIPLAGSPAIDKGSALECPTFDQRGALRPADGDENGSALCDVGAVEYNGIFPGFIYLPLVRR